MLRSKQAGQNLKKMVLDNDDLPEGLRGNLQRRLEELSDKIVGRKLAPGSKFCSLYGKNGPLNSDEFQNLRTKNPDVERAVQKLMNDGEGKYEQNFNKLINLMGVSKPQTTWSEGRNIKISNILKDCFNLTTTEQINTLQATNNFDSADPTQPNYKPSKSKAKLNIIIPGKGSISFDASGYFTITGSATDFRKKMIYGETGCHDEKEIQKEFKKAIEPGFNLDNSKIPSQMKKDIADYQDWRSKQHQAAEAFKNNYLKDNHGNKICNYHQLLFTCSSN